MMAFSSACFALANWVDVTSILKLTLQVCMVRKVGVRGNTVTPCHSDTITQYPRDTITQCHSNSHTMSP